MSELTENLFSQEFVESLSIGISAQFYEKSLCLHSSWEVRLVFSEFIKILSNFFHSS
jgi:hypothetical protein